MSLTATPTETDQPLVRDIEPPTSVLPRRRNDDDPARPLPTDDEEVSVPQQTVQVLAQARDAIFNVVGAVFTAAREVVEAILGLIQAIAGREVAERVDDRVAEVLDPFVPDGGRTPVPNGGRTPLPATPEELEAPAEPGSETPTEPETPDAPQEPIRLRDGVEGILHTHAQSNAERTAITPAFVDIVTKGAEFILSVERQFPGAIDALQAHEVQAQEASAPTNEPARGGGSAPDTAAAETHER